MGAHWETSQKGLARNVFAESFLSSALRGQAWDWDVLQGQLLAGPERSSKVRATLWLFRGVAQGTLGLIKWWEGGREEGRKHRSRKADPASPCHYHRSSDSSSGGTRFHVLLGLLNLRARHGKSCL